MLAVSATALSIMLVTASTMLPTTLSAPIQPTAPTGDLTIKHHPWCFYQDNHCIALMLDTAPPTYPSLKVPTETIFKTEMQKRDPAMCLKGYGRSGMQCYDVLRRRDIQLPSNMTPEPIPFVNVDPLPWCYVDNTGRCIEAVSMEKMKRDPAMCLKGYGRSGMQCYDVLRREYVASGEEQGGVLGRRDPAMCLKGYGRSGMQCYDVLRREEQGDAVKEVEKRDPAMCLKGYGRSGMQCYDVLRREDKTAEVKVDVAVEPKPVSDSQVAEKKEKDDTKKVEKRDPAMCLKGYGRSGMQCYDVL